MKWWSSRRFTPLSLNYRSAQTVITLEREIFMTNSPEGLKKQPSFLRTRKPILRIKLPVILATVCYAALIGSPLGGAQT